MKNKTITLTIIAFLTLSSFALLFTTIIPPAAAAPFNLSAEGPFAMDATPEMIGEKELAIRKQAAVVGSAIATGASLVGDPVVEGTNLTINVGDFDPDHPSYDETFYVLMDGINCVILIEKDAYINYDANTDEYVFANPNDVWREEDRISTAQLEYLRDEFDTNIYTTVTGIFGPLGLRGDPGDAHKVWVLIHNIRDESFYDPAETSYVAGYFGASENSLENKNMFHIDSYDWAHRCGNNLNPWFLDDANARPNLYEGTFAHEFEHMVHFDQDPDEPSWVDEGLADLAGYLCGYGHSDGHILYYLAYHWLTSLTFWGGGLQDYGASYLFQLYLFEKFGGIGFVSDLVQEQANGIEGIEKTLEAHGIYIPFDCIFDWWTIANYLDDTSMFGGMYGYDLLEMGSADTRGWTLDFSLGGYWGEPIFDKEWELEGWWGTPQPYTAHYYRFTTNKWSKMYIDGDDFAGTTAYSGTYEWYSETGAWAWRSFYQTFTIPADGATLNFMTFYDIEEDWDYGYVEVYNGTEWTTLEDINGHTVSTDPNGPQDNPNTPVGREPADYLVANNWHAFTGYSGGWVEVSMDLSQFAGETIDIHFRLWQDGAFTLQNMYVDEISIPEIDFFDDMEAGVGGWTTDGWILTDGILDNNFEVTILKLGYPLVGQEVPIELLGVSHIWVWSGTQSGRTILNKTGKNQIYLAIVSNRADHILPSGYVLGVEKKTGSWWNWLFS